MTGGWSIPANRDLRPPLARGSQLLSLALATSLFIHTAMGTEPPPLLARMPSVPVVSAIPVDSAPGDSPPGDSSVTPLPLVAAGQRTLRFPAGSVTVPAYTVKLDLWDSEGGPAGDPVQRMRAWARVHCPAPTVEAHLFVYSLVDMSYSAESLGPDGSHASFAEHQLIFADPASFPVQPVAPHRLYALRASQLPGGVEVFEEDRFNIACLGAAPTMIPGAAFAELSSSGSALVALISVEQSMELRTSLSRALYQPRQDTLLRLTLWPERPHAQRLQRTEDGQIVIQGGTVTRPCDASLGEQTAYVFSSLEWTPYKAGPDRPRLGPRYALEGCAPSDPARRSIVSSTPWPTAPPAEGARARGSRIPRSALKLIRL